MKWFKTILPVVTILGIFVVYPAYVETVKDKKVKRINIISDIVDQMTFKSELKVFSLLEKDWQKNDDEYTLPDNLPPLLEIAASKSIKKIPVVSPIKAVSLNENYKVNVSSVVNSAALDNKLGGVLVNKGQTIIQSAQANNICPIFLTAVLMHESGNGTSKFSKQKNNVSGIFLNGKYHTFDSVDECIRFTAKLLGGKLYAGGKHKTIKAVQQIYCPVGAANDPKKLNGHWLTGVMGYMEKLWGKTIHIRS